jgi:phosphonopyruvate decarboxylase
MIAAEGFVEAARGLGFTWYTGVPCSYLGPFINYVIDAPGLHYLAAANEGDAVATAAGLAIGGQRAVVMMQNSGLGNAVSPLTSLTHCFQIPLLILCTLRGEPAPGSGTPDEPQHELMGRITGELLDLMEIPWEYFPTEEDQIAPALARAVAHMEQAEQPYALIVRKGTVGPWALRTKGLARAPRAPCVLAGEGVGDAEGTGDKPGEEAMATVGGSPSGAARDAWPTRGEVLRRIVERTPPGGSLVVATTGHTGRELYALADRPHHLYMVGSMGCASALGLGLALALPKRRIAVVDGDGAALMRLGNLATVGAYAGGNYAHFLLDNEAHDSTGGQYTVSSGVRFRELAAATGYGFAAQGASPAVVDMVLDAQIDGPRLGHVKIRSGTQAGSQADLPRPQLAPPEAVRRLMDHLGTGFRPRRAGFGA